MEIILIFLFFLSGFSSLIYQVIWLKKLNLIFGVTTPSIVASLVSFMLGLSIGSFFFGKKAFKFKNPFLFYGILEGTIGLYAITINSLFKILDKIFIFSFQYFSDFPFILDFLRFLLSLLILFFPTFLMGGTFPLIIDGIERRGLNYLSKTALLYGINTLGAFFGTFISTFYLIPKFGFSKTNTLAILINFFIFFSSILFIRIRFEKIEKKFLLKINFPVKHFLIIFFMGFTSFSYEVLWNRVMLLHSGSNVYGYGITLCNILMGIGLGSLAYNIFFKRKKAEIENLGFVELFLSIFIIFQIFLFIKEKNFLEFFASYPWGNVQMQVFGSLFLSSLISLFIPSFLMGISFPLSVNIFSWENEPAGKSVGSIYGINTLGCITGSIITGFSLIPLIGTTRSIFLMAFINSLISYLLFKKNIYKTLSIFILILITIFLISFPGEKIFLSAGIYYKEENKVKAFKEDTSGAIVVIEREEGKSLEINGTNVAGTSPDLFLIQKLQGHIPLLSSKEEEKVLHIGLGSGGTLYSVSLHPVKEIYVAEISSGVLKLSSAYFKDINKGAIFDKRVRIKIMDGRNFILGTKEKFNVILSDSIHPKHYGNGFLYTKDYFLLLKEKLKENGVVSMWLPLYSLTLKNYKEILKAFSEVFQYIYIWWFPEPMNAFTIAVGLNFPIDLNSFFLKMEREPIIKDLKEINLNEKEKIASCLIFEKEILKNFLKDVKPHEDDLPTVEYESNKVFTKTKTWLIILSHIYENTKNFSLKVEKFNLRKEIYEFYRKKVLKEMERQIDVLKKADIY